MSYQNMPSVAQHLPTKDTLENDHGTNLEIYQCSGCGLVQLSIEPVSYYKEVIRAVGYSPEMKEFRTKQFGKFVQTYSLAGKKVLEIGSGKGEYLSLMKEAGTDTYGIEFGEDSVKTSLECNLKVSKGFIDSTDYSIAGGPFDAFFIISFFEHVPDPNTLLQGIAHNLTKDGVGIVEVPNFDMMIRENLFSEFMRDHLFYFTQETLRTTLEINGFEVLEIKEVWHDYILSATVKKREKINLSAFENGREQMKKSIEKFLSKHTTVAVWGAGHQAFAVMSMMNMAGKIKYVVDSAPFKQGKFTPATHIPIVSPDTLKNEPVEAIIIMAGSYSNEIKKIILRDYQSTMEIVILTESGLSI